MVTDLAKQEEATCEDFQAHENISLCMSQRAICAENHGWRTSEKTFSIEFSLFIMLSPRFSSTREYQHHEIRILSSLLKHLPEQVHQRQSRTLELAPAIYIRDMVSKVIWMRNTEGWKLVYKQI